MLLANEPLHIDCHFTPLVIYLENRHVGHMPDVGSLWYLGRVHSRPSCKLLCTSRRIVTVHAAKASVWNSVEPRKEPSIFSTPPKRNLRLCESHKLEPSRNQVEPRQEPSGFPAKNGLCVTWANAEPSGTKPGTKAFFDPSYGKPPFLLTTLTPIYITK